MSGVEEKFKDLNFWKVLNLEQTNGETRYLEDCINMDHKHINDWICDNIATTTGITKSLDKKNLIMHQMKDYEEKLELSIIEPNFFGFYEVFRKSRFVYGLAFETAHTEARIYMHKNKDKYLHRNLQRP